MTWVINQRQHLHLFLLCHILDDSPNILSSLLLDLFYSLVLVDGLKTPFTFFSTVWPTLSLSLSDKLKLLDENH